MSAAAAKAHPELKTIDDIIARPDLFPHPEDPSKGGLHTCPSGWGASSQPTICSEPSIWKRRAGS